MRVDSTIPFPLFVYSVHYSPYFPFHFVPCSSFRSTLLLFLVLVLCFRLLVTVQGLCILLMNVVVVVVVLWMEIVVFVE